MVSNLFPSGERETARFDFFPWTCFCPCGSLIRFCCYLLFDLSSSGKVKLKRGLLREWRTHSTSLHGRHSSPTVLLRQWLPHCKSTQVQFFQVSSLEQSQRFFSVSSDIVWVTLVRKRLLGSIAA